MTTHRPARTLRPPVLLAAFALCLVAVLLATSILTAPAAEAQAPGAGSTDENEAVPGTSAHNLEPTGYTAQGLLGARWDVGAVQANWNHRPIWHEPVTGQGVRVAVIDTGVDADHPDLRGRVTAWRDFVNKRDRPYDDTGHGTHVAGIIAAGGHNQLRPDQAYFLTGARGLAPDAEIIAAKAMDHTGRGDPSRIAQAILWALDPNGDGQGAHIINLSLGVTLPESDAESIMVPGTSTSRPSGSLEQLRQAIVKATEAGAIVVVAAGNHEATEEGHIHFPGTMDEVITVGATDPTGHVAAFSNTGRPGGNKPDVVAPGIVVSTSPLHGEPIARYRGLGGTSMSAPFVTGTIALMLEADPSLREHHPGRDNSANTERVRTILRSSAQSVPGATATEQGAGMLRVDAALQAAGTGDAAIRPAAYATPVVIGIGGYWIVRGRRRSRRAAARAPGGDSPRSGGVQTGPHGPAGVGRAPGFVPLVMESAPVRPRPRDARRPLPVPRSGTHPLLHASPPIRTAAAFPPNGRSRRALSFSSWVRPPWHPRDAPGRAQAADVRAAAPDEIDRPHPGRAAAPGVRAGSGDRGHGHRGPTHAVGTSGGTRGRAPPP